ncbi:MAG: HAD-IA family hydrolase [Acidobacteria bacterium]|nr:HAD-IA family hydrolase [Acidobacteriota bacterium]MCA1651122.1 HAD-IA family hydrolase [Acidobacteriota bacterium]
MPRAVLFDLDDTLFDHYLCTRTALGVLHNRHECFRALDFATFEHAHGQYLEELHQSVLEGRLDLDAARTERFKRLYARAGVKADPEMVATAAAAYRHEYKAARTAVAGAEGLLTRVRDYARIGVVSNNVREEQEEKLRHCGLDRFVDALVVSEEVGAAKPDPEIFRVALERLACSADQAVMVGDSWAADIAGARRLGMRAIWFNRGRRPSPEPESLIQEITAFEPVEDAIEVIFGGDLPGAQGRP